MYPFSPAENIRKPKVVLMFSRGQRKDALGKKGLKKLEMYLGPSQTSMMKRFAKMVDNIQLLTNFANSSVINVDQAQKALAMVTLHCNENFFEAVKKASNGLQANPMKIGKKEFKQQVVFKNNDSCPVLLYHK